MSTPTYDPFFDPTIFDFSKTSFSAPGVRPRWVYVPKTVYTPKHLASDVDLIKGLTIFYGGTAAGEGMKTMLAVLHPTEAEDAERVGWNFTTLQMEGDDAPQIITRARGRRCWWVAENDAVLKALIDLAKARDGQHEEQRLQVSRVRSEHASDIETIGTALQEEAESRGWCSEYDEFVEGLNHRLTFDLPLREREYEVEIEATYRMTVTVTAHSEESAMEEIGDEDVDHGDATQWTLSSVETLEATAQD